LATPPPISEHDPSAATPYLAWAQNSRAHPQHFDYFARVGNAPRFRVNRSGTQAHGGGVSGTLLTFQQIRGGQADIKLFDLTSKTRMNPPSGVNTPRFEWRPSVSGDWLLFGRQGPRHRRMLLVNLTTHELRTLSIVDAHDYDEPDQVNGNYAVYMRCTHLPVCNVWRYDIAAKTSTRIPNPNHRLHSAPSVSTNGTVFLDSSGFLCGDRPRIKRYPISGSPTIVFRFQQGRDTDATFVDESAPQPRLLYTRTACNANYDIYQATPITP
jgi:hypothetical protein